MKRLFWAALAAAFLLPAGMASLAEARVLPVIEHGRQLLPVQGRDPDLSEGGNGDMIVRFRSGCRMVFNRVGRAIDVKRCSRDQEARGHEAVAAHMRRHGRRGRGDTRITELRGGRLEVVVPRGCSMIFDRIGRVIDAQHCSRAQEARGHEAVAAHMRRHGRRAPGDARITELRGGRLEVLVPRGCRMIFDRIGRAIDAQHCSRAQEARGHESVAAHMRRQGRRGHGEPKINEVQGGRLRVLVPGGCTMIFDRIGRAIDAKRCTRAQEARGHEAVAAHMRRHGRRGRGDPRINELRGGRLEVLFRSGCRITFSRHGRPTGASQCSHPQERRAQEEVTAYLYRQELGGPPRREARIIEHRSGSLEVIFSSGCKMRFSRRGRAVDAQRCSPGEEARAKSLAAEYNQARRRR